MVAAEMAILPQRCKEVLFSDPNSSYGEGLLVAKGNPDNVHTYQDFAKSDKKIAIMAGADQLEMLQALGVPADRMVTISNNADAISTVSTGRASAYAARSEEHTSELQSLMRISYAVFCLEKKKQNKNNTKSANPTRHRM